MRSANGSWISKRCLRHKIKRPVDAFPDFVAIRQAKRIINLINAVAEAVDNDPDVLERLQVALLHLKICRYPALRLKPGHERFPSRWQ